MNSKRKSRYEDRWHYWRGVIQKAARSGRSVRAFCEEEGIGEAQFYTWRRKLKTQGKAGNRRGRGTASPKASFALVSPEGDAEAIESAGIELVLAGGRRLRIGKGVDAQTLASVVSALEAKEC